MKRLPYPYRMEQGRIVLGFRKRKAIRAAFEVLRVLGGYKEAARVFNAQGFQTYHGAQWTRQSARMFCRNPIHAGFWRSRDGWARMENFPDPPVTLDEFLAANDGWACREDFPDPHLSHEELEDMLRLARRRSE